MTALDNRIKKHIYAHPHELRVIPAPGWKSTCEDELKHILRSFTQPGKFPAAFQEDPEGIGVGSLDFRQLIEVPQRLLTAQACYWKILDRHVGSFGELSHVIDSLDFELYFPLNTALSLKVQSFQSHLYHEGKLYDSISTILEKYGFALDDDAPMHLLAEQRGNRFRLYLALGPYPLHHRSYKAAGRHSAPLQECLAAAALRWSLKLQKDWQPDQLVVPFAGSGTLLFEAWMLLGQIPSYLWNARAYLEQLPATPQATLQSIRKRLLTPQQLPPALLIEKDADLAQGLLAHVEHFIAPMSERPTATTVCGDLFQTMLPEANRIFAPLNPPYGLRLEQDGKARSADFYRQLGAFLKQWPTKGQDLRGFVLIPDEDALRAMHAELGNDSVLGIQSFSQGGQHIRCMAFRVEPVTPR